MKASRKSAREIDSARVKICSRIERENLESRILAPYAYQSKGVAKTRRYPETPHAYRTAFQRDRDRIIHCRAFRRLKHKRQVFLTFESDHYRTRITHTLEVSQLSRTLARALGLNEDLVEAISLGHDIGHTPFGHLGEVILNDIMKGRHTLGHRRNGRDFGGFKHNYQSLRIVDLLEKRYDFDGLNLTAPVREGILKHTGFRRKHLDYPDFETEGLHFECEQPTSLEGQVVAICDEIAQRTHDLEDGIRADLVDLQKVRRLKIIKYVEKKWQIVSGYEKDHHLFLEKMIRGLINLLIDDVLQTTMTNLHDWFSRKSTTLFDEEIVGFSAEIDPIQRELNKFIYKNIIDFSRVQWSDELGGKLVSRLFEAYYREPELLPDDTLTGLINNERQTGSSLTEAQKEILREDAAFFRIICDYIAGMTDHFALKEAERLAEMHKIDASDLHIDYALGKRRTDSAA